MRGGTSPTGHPESNPTFQGKLTTQLVNSGTPTTAGRITSGNVYGWIENVVNDWSCTLAYRYDGFAWNTAPTTGTFEWGTLILSDTSGCNWVVGSTDYLKTNGGTSCPGTDTTNAMTIALGPQGIYQNDVDHNDVGDFSFVHSDCTSPYTGHKVLSGKSFSTGGSADNRPGSNCDGITIDGTNTDQIVTYDSTAPSIAFDAPAAGGPVTVPSAFYAVQFDATDVVAGFGGGNGWSLQRQVATWSGSACGTFGPDGSAVSGTANASNQISGQSLTLGKCYRWTLTATDLNNNTASTITSGSILPDTSGVLGLQPHQRIESWDLGAGDTLAASVGSGNLLISHPIVDLPIRGSSVSIGLVYNSHDAGNVGFGPGWRLDVQRRLAINGNGTVTFTDGTGTRHTFANPSTVGTVTTYTRPSTLYATLVKDTSISANEFILTYRDQSKDKFDILGSEGILVRAEDRFGNGATVGYVASTNRIIAITDTAASPNRTIDFAYDGSNRLTSITDWAYVSGGVVQTGSTGSRRATRFFYDGSSSLAGWADGLNTSGSCPTGGSHLTCLTLTGGLVTAIGKTQTVETISGSPLALGSTIRSISTQVTYTGSDVTAVKDAEQVAASGAGATFSHPGPGQTKVVRPGTPASETTYALASVTDGLGRITSVKRKLGGTQIEQRTTYDSTYPIEPASVVDNYVNGVVGDGANPTVDDRTTTYAYLGSTLGLLSLLTEPLTASVSRTTSFTYDSNNDLTQKVIDRSPADHVNQPAVTTRYCFDAGCGTSPASPSLTMSRRIDNYVNGTAGDGAANVEDVTTTFTYDPYGQVTLESRANYNAAGTLLDAAATGSTYDDKGNRTKSIANFANGTVTNPGDDVTPNSTTNARTDLTARYTHDTAGNQVSTADPRREILSATGSPAADDYLTRFTFDALDQQLSETTPTTPGIAAQTTAATVWDELGLERQATDHGGKVTGTLRDAAGRAIETYQDDDGAGATAARVTGRSAYDAAGRLTWTEDAVQATDPVGGADPGRTEQTYDELGRATATIEAAGSVAPAVASTTVKAYDALDRTTSETVGSGSTDAQTTNWRYDLGGRVTDQDDEFTCATTTYDYRDLPTSTIEGRAPGNPCTGTGSRTIATNHDALGRQTARTVSGGDTLEATTFDAAGRALRTWSTEGSVERVTETEFNPLDEPVSEDRYSQPVGGGTKTGETWARTNHDAAGNETDRCTWAAMPSELCHNANDATWASPAPTTRASVEFDARNNRIRQFTPGLGTTTYDPAADYRVKGTFIPTAAGKEHQTLYAYDGRDRLDTITVQVCSVSQDPCQSGNIVAASQRVLDDYDYDTNDNRTQVVENNGAGAVTRTYGYDGRNQLITDSSTATTCAANSQAFAYDAAGNRTCAGGRTFTYTDAGQLETCSITACSPVFDADGRLTKASTATGTWSYQYDGESRLVAACKSTSCTGSGVARFDFDYDGEGHRTRITETPASGTATVTDLTYEGDKVVREVATTGANDVTRTFTVDEAGAIWKVEIATTPTPSADDGTYLVTWNGHGDAVELARIDPTTGSLTPANRFGYSTWGTPTLTTVNGFGDLGFRYRYVGRFDVQWDSTTAVPAELLYMHARHYAPEFGRFLTPDPSDAEANLYGYAENSPVVLSDCSGNRSCLRVAIDLVVTDIVLSVRYRAIRENRGVGNGPLPMAGKPGETTVSTHQEQFRGWQRHANKVVSEWNKNCKGGGGGGPWLPPGLFTSLRQWMDMPTPSPIRKPPYYRPRIQRPVVRLPRVRVPAPFWMYLMWPWRGTPCGITTMCGSGVA